MKIYGVDATKRKLRRDARSIVDMKQREITESILEDLKEATPIDTGKARDGWNIARKDIVNEVEYIDGLNNGASNQAPAKFVESTVLSNPNVIPNGSVVTYR